jgi:hypothetical protein
MLSTGSGICHAADKRALENPTAIAYKRKDISAKTEGEKWQFCELKNERDIENALACLSKAYSARRAKRLGKTTPPNGV